MDISGLVDYEFLYTLELRHPVTDAPLGITFRIRSAGSEAVKKIQRQHLDRNLERRMKSKAVTTEQIERDELERAASYIAAWDWGDNTYGGVRPELTIETACEILAKENWIYAAVVEAATKIENFSLAR